MPFEKQPIHLSDAQRDDLEEIARSHALAAGFVQPAQDRAQPGRQFPRRPAPVTIRQTLHAVTLSIYSALNVQTGEGSEDFHLQAVGHARHTRRSRVRAA